MKPSPLTPETIEALWLTAEALADVAAA